MTTHKYLSVLLLEDNHSDATFAVRELNRAGFKVSAQVVSSESAFRQQLLVHTFDLVLCDHGVGGWTGIEALETLQALRIDIPLIMLTGSLDDEFARECIKRGAADWVRKDQLHRLPIAVMQAISQKKLTNAQELEVVNQATADLAHDLNNLLAVISGNAELLERGVKEDELKRFAKNIATATKCASDITRQLLAFNGKRQPACVRGSDS